MWLNKNRRELIPEVSPEQQAIFDRGYSVENLARRLFSQGVEVQDNYQKARAETKTLIEKGVTVIYQATAMPPSLLSRADILVWNKELKGWDLYEVKSSTELKEEHLQDIGFQKITMERDGIKIVRTFLICINGEYIREEKIKPEKLLKIIEISEKIKNIESILENQIPKAIEWLKSKTEPEERVGKRCKSPNECPFKEYCWKEIPTHSIFEISRLSGRKLESLLDQKIIKIEDLPEDFKLSEKQQNHVMSVKTRQAFINDEKIRNILEKMAYPLCFLDYETFAPAIPSYKGTKPYQQICFQYSLHILKEKGGELEHYEFLETSQENPIPKLLAKLAVDMCNTGTVLVWNKGFEMGRNKEMAASFPKYRVFLENLNARVFDLMEIFRDQDYLHPEFHGSYSIKKVLPVLAPGISHQDLEIHNGGMASLGWYRMVFCEMNKKDQKKVAENLLEYCKLDTLAMVMIYKSLLAHSA